MGEAQGQGVFNSTVVGQIEKLRAADPSQFKIEKFCECVHRSRRKFLTMALAEKNKKSVAPADDFYGGLYACSEEAL